MIKIKNSSEIKLMTKAGEIVGLTHKYLEDYIKPGITTKELDTLAHNFIIEQNAIPSFKGYNGFPNSICTSINEEVVHGIPSKRKLKEGDIISIDIGVCYKGYHGDSAWTYPVGQINDDKKFLLEHTLKSLEEGLKVIRDGAKVGDIGYAISNYIKKYNLGVVKVLVGHGIGNQLHEDPEIPNYGFKNSGPTLKKGMVIAVEPMINLGIDKVFIEDDGWTIVTADKLPSAHFEHTVLVTERGFKILTKR